MSVEVFATIVLLGLVPVGALAFSARRLASAVFATVVVGLYFLLPPPAFAVVGTILFVLVLGAPLFVTLGVFTILCLYLLSPYYQTLESYELIAERIFSLTDKNVLLAIPFFVVAGAVMTAGGIARRIVDFADAIVGGLPGGLAAAAVLACMFFAAISGSSPVTVIAIGSIMYPALVAKGYPKDFSLGLVTASGSLGILIPPSIPMIVYAVVVGGSMQVDVADLFMAGVTPGLLIGGILIAYSVWTGVRRPSFSWRTLRAPDPRLVLTRFRDGFWALLLPVLILGGIYPLFGGRALFTPTEAAASAVAYAFFVELLVHRELEWRHVPEVLAESGVLMGSLLTIIVMSFAFNHFLVEQKVVDAATVWMTNLDLGRLGFLLLLNLLLLVIGCLMDVLSAILIVAPLVAPIAAGYQIAPLHLAIVFVVNLEIGYLTPPIGLNLFVSSSLFKAPVGRVIRATVPFTLLMLLGLAAIVAYEPIAGGLPRVLSGGSWSTPGVGELEEGAAREADIQSLEELMNEAAVDVEPAATDAPPEGGEEEDR
ncbi:MAG: TRAP transporter large permease subunit [Alphaproteobacteria bacterium]|nr:TRAP transporter large permease subunit [Deltaproteobacteria bacterium]MCB9690210.1 TRAP transporter large permease subunit [Alphaproteobacteria bacterium]